MIDEAYRRRAFDGFPLFARDEPPRSTPRQATRWTTQDEAYRNAPNGVAARIVSSLFIDGPATCDELEQRLSMTHQAASSALNRLMRAGRVVANGSRLTRSGRRARVWELTP